MERDDEDGQEPTRDAGDAHGGAREQGNGGGLRSQRHLSDYVELAMTQVEHGREQAATGLERTATKLREHPGDAAEAGRTTRDKVAHGMENAAGYMHGHRTEEIAGDVWKGMKSHPARLAALVFLTGLLLGRALR